MYLKALEIQGFKSFPDKTVFTFGSDVTAIVGPNGSGKSNVADAIRWVMGEQSTKELRGGKMEDVIFGGTPKRAPVGYAQVSLIIDNSDSILSLDDAEVMVTRRYYRSGESEFYINRRSVRLKDIQELFMDTGMGREGYSVIGQGRIDEILSTKSEDRREVFESAAGIAKFRRRKEEAERKIATTEANLLRINDKIAELELQVEPLREQSEKAKKYLVLRDELRSNEVSLWMETLDKLRAENLKLRTDADNARRELNVSKQQQETMYEYAEQLNERVREKDIEREAARCMLSSSESTTAELESAAAVLRANIQNNLQSIESLQVDAERQKAQIEALQGRVEEYTLRIASIEAEREEIASRSRAFVEQAAKAAEQSGKLEDEIELLRLRAAQENELREQAAVKLSALNAAAGEMKRAISANREDAVEAKEAFDDAKEKKTQVKNKLDAAINRQTETANIIKGYSMRLQSREQEVSEKEEEFNQFTLELGSMNSRIKLLSDMEKEYEGFSRAVKTVMQRHNSGALKGVHGPLANLIRTDQRYTVAIEIALGTAAQNIVVDSETDAKVAINELKRRDAGRATFLPLNVIHGRKMSENLSGEIGFVGIASELVKYEHQYSDVVGNFLGRTVVTDNMDNAISMARKFKNRFRIVTLDGQVINTGGSMTGGSVGKNVGILSRAEELERLKKEFGLLHDKKQNLRNELDECIRQREAARFEMNTAMEEKRAADDERLRCEAELTRVDGIYEAAKKEVENLTVSASTLEKRLQENAQETSQIEHEIELRAKSAAELEAKWSEKQMGREQMRDDSDELSEKIMQLTAEDAALRAELSAAEKAMDEQNSLLSELMLDGEERERTAEQRRLHAAELEKQLEEISEKLREASDQCELQRGRVNEIGEQRLVLEAERTQQDKALQDLNAQLLNMERECARLEQKKLAADMEEKQIIDKLWDSYELNYTTAQSVRQPVDSVSKCRSSIADIKRKINALGTPNIGAIEEFERINARYEFLTGERDDVENAKRELNGVIDELTEQMKSIFQERFAQINHHFNETFVEMFGGGKASLELGDEQDILECDIEIKAQPPGKSLKTISLLSGGEKAFAAIALYFAMLKVRPTPFCMIDEIDAALDAANVVRFADYMRRMSDKTQFIVITHRRATMERADMLYGLTMQQQGVTKMLTINLDEAEREFIKKDE